jgi:hypothetical protein
MEPFPSPGGNVARPLLVVDHPISRNVNWQAIAGKLQWRERLPFGPAQGGSSEWTPIIQAGGHVLLAVRSEPVRQVWVGFDASTLAASPEFVIFWTNVFDWTGRSGDQFAAYNLAERTDQWKLVFPVSRSVTGEEPLSPGIFQRDGVYRAFNASVPELRQPPRTNWQAALSALGGHLGRTFRAGPYAYVLALTCLAGAAATWRNDRRLGSALYREINPGVAEELRGALSR